MIIVKNRELLIPREEFNIGTNYDDNTETRLFRLSRVTAGGVDLSNMSFHLDLSYTNDEKDTAALEKEVTDDYINLTLTIANSMLQVPGTVLIQIRALDLDGTLKWTSYPGALFVEDSINTPAQYSGDLTELEQLEAALSAAETARVLAEEARAAAETAREAAEELRQIQERARQLQETSRVASETTREANARILEENSTRIIAQMQATEEAAERAAQEAAAQATAIENLREDLEQRLAGGEFKGDKGDKGDTGEKGESGITVPLAGFFTMYVDENGDLYAVGSQDLSDEFYYDSTTGNLYWQTEEN